MRLGGDHDRRALSRGAAGDSLTRPQFGAAGHFLDPRAVSRPKNELAGALLVEVDETGVSLERLGNLACYEAEDLLEVERRVDGRNRLGQEP